MAKSSKATVETLDIRVNPEKFTPEQLREEYGNWSKAIRALTADGYSRSEIASLLGKRYQHVRNVQVTALTGK